VELHCAGDALLAYNQVIWRSTRKADEFSLRVLIPEKSSTLSHELFAWRGAHEASLLAVIAALKNHGNGVDDAQAFSTTRDQLAWRLRQASLTIGKVLDLTNKDDD
jgi:hypothetical protein